MRRQRHHEQGHQRRAHAVESGTDLTVELVCDLEDAAGDQERNGA